MVATKTCHFSPSLASLVPPELFRHYETISQYNSSREGSNTLSGSGFGVDATPPASGHWRLGSVLGLLSGRFSYVFLDIIVNHSRFCGQPSTKGHAIFMVLSLFHSLVMPLVWQHILYFIMLVHVSDAFFVACMRLPASTTRSVVWAGWFGRLCCCGDLCSPLWRVL